MIFDGLILLLWTGGGGYFRQNRAWMCLPNLENLTFSISTQYSIENNKILPKLCAFYNDFLKIHTMLNLGTFVSNEKRTDRNTKFELFFFKFCENAP